jgi:hypothetical protein
MPNAPKRGGKRRSQSKVVDAELGAPVPSTTLQETSEPRAVPLVFISHDSRDADLAEAFDHLLTDASGGVIQTFRSSDQSGRAGIDYGENWYATITRSLAESTDVVALLTPNSVGRPWILFEAGFAIGRLDSKVFGIAIGLPLPKAVTGPFAQFQNCEATEESLTTVVIKLIQRNPNARPREQAVRKQVQAFLEEIGPLLKERSGDEGETQEELDATAVAKVFEEVKVMFRDLPSRVESELQGHGTLRKRRRFHPMMVEEIFHMADFEGADQSMPWLLLGSIFRDEVPWLAESALEMYRAVQSENPERIETAQRSLQSLLRVMRHSKLFRRFLREDDETFFMFRHLPDMIEQFSLLTTVEQKKGRRGKSELPPALELESETEK